MAEEESAVLHLLLELVVVVALVDVGIAEGLGLLKNVLLDFVQKVLNILCNTLNGARLLL